MNLLKLLADNRSAPRRFEVVNAAGDEATVYLYDAIDPNDEMAAWLGGIGPKAFITALNAIKAPVIHLRVNSPGGDVFAARAIEQAIKEHPSKVVAHIDGVAASAASFISLAADEVEIAKGAFFMIHNASTIAMGNASDFLETAALLEKVDASIVDTYVDVTGQDREKITAMMDAETWITAQEAVDLGFADRIAEAPVKNAASWNLSAYSKAPEIAAQAEPDTSITDQLSSTLNCRLHESMTKDAARNSAHQRIA